VKQATELTTTLATVNADVESQMSNSCSCNRQISYYDESGVYFDGLDATEKYFAVIARSEVGSLFGMPTSPISPDAQSNSRPRTSSTSNQIRRLNSSAHDSSSISADEDNAVPCSFEGLDESDTVSSEEGDLPVSGQKGSSASREDASRNEVELQSAFEEDAKSWESWHATALHLLFSPAIPTVVTNTLVCGSNTVSRAADMLTLTAITV
jgi:hypothetical protein